MLLSAASLIPCLRQRSEVDAKPTRASSTQKAAFWNKYSNRPWRNNFLRLLKLLLLQHFLKIKWLANCSKQSLALQKISIK
jgi:hypothetical protein